METTKITKKAFKEACSFHEYGKGQNKRNAIYYGLVNGDHLGYRGFRFMVKSEVRLLNKHELFNMFYLWVTEGVTPTWQATYRYAQTDDEAFKVSLMG